MVIKRSSASEVARLLDDVASQDEVRRDAAVARLAVIGARAVDRVLVKLDAATDDTDRLALWQVLEAIGDLRALPAAQRALAEGPAAIRRVALSVICAAMHAPDGSASARALAAATDVALDPTAAPELRRAAIDALAQLGDAVFDPIRKALERAPVGPDKHQAESDRQSAPVPSASAFEVSRWLAGETPASPTVVRQAIVTDGDSWPLPTLHHALERVRDFERRETDEDNRQGWLATRGAIHQVLAERDSRVALYDLRETLETLETPLPVGMVAALDRLADPSLLDAVATGWHRIADEWTRAQLVEAFRAIVTRAGLTKRHAALRRVAARHPEFVATTLGPERHRR